MIDTPSRGSMLSWASTDATRRSMLGNKARDTKPELKVRQLLHARGYRYRVDFKLDAQIRSRADIVFTRQRLAVYIDGCFWHGCPIHGTRPKANGEYWNVKLSRNAERDSAVGEALRDRGWLVLRFWEHERPNEVAATVAAAVDARRGARSSK
jgi:DNA mismatch endonuclease (patch repair protein)